MADLLENGLNFWLMLCLWMMNAINRACLDTNMTGILFYKLTKENKSMKTNFFTYIYSENWPTRCNFGCKWQTTLNHHLYAWIPLFLILILNEISKNLIISSWCYKPLSLYLLFWVFSSQEEPIVCKKLSSDCRSVFVGEITPAYCWWTYKQLMSIG